MEQFSLSTAILIGFLLSVTFLKVKCVEVMQNSQIVHQSWLQKFIFFIISISVFADGFIYIFILYKLFILSSFINALALFMASGFISILFVPLHSFITIRILDIRMAGFLGVFLMSYWPEAYGRIVGCYPYCNFWLKF